MSAPGAAVGRILARSPGAQRSGDGWMIPSPFRDERTPSVSLRQGDVGALLHDFGDESRDGVEIAEALGLTAADLFDDPRHGRDGSASRAASRPVQTALSAVPPPAEPAPDLGPEPVTVASLAEARRLDVAALVACGVRDYIRPGRKARGKDAGRPALPAAAIPYLDRDGRTQRDERYRVRHVGGTKTVSAMSATRKAKDWRTVPYGREDLDRVVEKGSTLSMAESESTRWALRAAGVLALTFPGAGSAGCLEAEDVAGVRRVVIFPDTDDAGAAFVRDLAARLAEVGYAGQVNVAAPLVGPDGAPVKDPADLWMADPDRERFRAALGLAVKAGTTAADWVNANPAPEKPERGGGGRPSTVGRLLALVEDAELWRTTGGEAVMAVRVGAHRENLRVRRADGDAGLWLSRAYVAAHGAPPNGAALRTALRDVTARVRFGGEVHPGDLRVGGDGESEILLDLGRDDWKMAKVTAAGWEVIDGPARFLRPPRMLALPLPERGGSLAALRRLLNLRDGDKDAAWALVLGWLLGALRPIGPTPALVLAGPQGAAKSSAARVLAGLVDPHGVALRSEPRDPRDLVAAASNAWVVALDNLSGLPGWLSDALCALASGTGFAGRALYSDADEHAFTGFRPVILTGIDVPPSRSDLLDRCLVVELEAIPEDKRRTEAEVNAEVDRVRPRLLGALLDAAACGLRRVPEVRPDRLPRLADWARFVAAAEPALPLAPGDFLAALRDSRETADALALESDAVALAVVALARAGGFEAGTATDLLAKLDAVAGEKVRGSKGWPSSARTLSGLLRRAAATLAAVGIAVTFNRSPGSAGRQRLVTIQALPLAEDSAKAGGDAERRGDDGDAKRGSSYCETRETGDRGVGVGGGVNDVGEPGDPRGPSPPSPIVPVPFDPLADVLDDAAEDDGWTVEKLAREGMHAEECPV